MPSKRVMPWLWTTGVSEKRCSVSLRKLSEVATAAKLAETAAREASAKAREEAGVLRLDLQKSESRCRTMQYMSAVLLVASRHSGIHSGDVTADQRACGLTGYIAVGAQPPVLAVPSAWGTAGAEAGNQSSHGEPVVERSSLCGAGA